MKKLIFVLAISIMFVACKKHDTPAPVDNTDYADSVVGAYDGTQIIYQMDNSTIQNYSATATITVTKTSKNNITVHFANSYGGCPFNLSKQADGNILLSPSQYSAYGTNNNNYTFATKKLAVYVKGTFYYDVSATKQ